MVKGTLTVNGLHIGGTSPVRIMGVINLSPESFYSDSIVTDDREILSRAKQMIEEGADILDIGGASTAPSKYYDTKDISRETELERITSSLDILVKAVDVPISIDTTSAVVAEAALNIGAMMVNDVSGLQVDSNMATLVAKQDVPVIIMAHCPEGCKSVTDSYEALQKSLRIADSAGIPEDNIILDPGIGFGKPPEVDIETIRNLQRFHDFQKPVLVGISRKAFIGAILNEKDPKNRLIGSLATTAIAVVNGADIVRTHDVMETRLTVQMAEQFR